jgi:transglutaminase-like putative cysteine protease
MPYDIRLSISHSYAQPAGNSRHLLRVLPKAIPGRQHISAHLTQVSPPPDHRQDRADFYGTTITSVSHAEPHGEMKVDMACRVEMTPPRAWRDRSPTLAGLRDEVAQSRDLGPASPVHFLGPSYRISPDAEIAEFAQSVVRKGESAAQTVIRLGAALHAAMTFDATATTVDTAAAEAFAQRRGVCQDFTHIMIIALQSLGIPAGYVSGYLRTLPPEGQPKLEGVDAMHAWVQAWCGAAQGWVEYDPTNATLIGTDHIVVGFGRDYADVSPVLGHLRSSGAPVATQTVDVTWVD